MQVQRTGGLLKEKAVRCTVPGRFIPNPRTVAQNFPSALTSHQVWNSSHFPLAGHVGLHLAYLPLEAGVRLTVALPSPLSGGRPRRGGSPSGSRNFSVSVFTLVFLDGGSPTGSLGFLLAVQRRHRCPMVFPLDPMATG